MVKHCRVHLACHRYLLWDHDVLPANRTPMENIILILQAVSLNVQPFLEASLVELVALEQVIENVNLVIVILGLSDFILLLLKVLLHFILLNNLSMTAAQCPYYCLV